MVGWFKSQIYKHVSLSGLRAVRQLNPATQRAIAKEVCAFIDMASVGSGSMLPLFFDAARHERQQAVRDGTATQNDPVWAAASLKESWAAAKLGKAHKKLNPSAADAIIQEIESFAFDPKHQLWSPNSGKLKGTDT